MVIDIVNNKEVVLISGGSGLVGTKLSTELSALKYEVRILTRSKIRAKSNPHFFYWNIESQELDEKCLIGVNHLFNLSGTSVGEGLWTKKRKAQLVDSRISGTKLLYEKISEKNIELTTYFGASAVGYYGSIESSEAHLETDEPGQDFLADLCQQWEAEHLAFRNHCKNLYIGRIANVLSSEGGFMQPFSLLSRLKLKIYMGEGRQMVSWIHLDDLVGILIESIRSNYEGTYNLSAGSLSSKELQDRIYTSMGKQWFRILIPGIFLKLMMGEMSILMLGSSQVSNQKILGTSLVNDMYSIDKAMSKII